MEYVQAAALLIAALGFLSVCLAGALYLMAWSHCVSHHTKEENTEVRMRQGHLTCDICTEEWDVSWPAYIDPTTLRVRCPHCNHEQMIEI